MKQITFVWQLAMTPFYYSLLFATTVVVLAALGPKEATEFWSRNK